MEKELNLETIAQGDYSDHNNKSHYVYRMDDDKSGLDTSNIDFEKEMVLAVYMGPQTSGGYSTTIEKAVELDDKVEVYIRERTPEPDSMNTMAITTPYHAVKTERVDKKVEFKYL